MLSDVTLRVERLTYPHLRWRGLQEAIWKVAREELILDSRELTAQVRRSCTVRPFRVELLIVKGFHVGKQVGGGGRRPSRHAVDRIVQELRCRV